MSAFPLAMEGGRPQSTTEKGKHRGNQKKTDWHRMEQSLPTWRRTGIVVCGRRLLHSPAHRGTLPETRTTPTLREPTSDRYVVVEFKSLMVPKGKGASFPQSSSETRYILFSFEKCLLLHSGMLPLHRPVSRHSLSGIPTSLYPSSHV